MDTIRVGIVGATGFAGAELARLIAQHPVFEAVALTAGAEAGTEMGKLYPALEHVYPKTNLVPHDDESLLSCDVVFTAVPHTAGMQHAQRLAEAGVSVVDLSADFRFSDNSRYESIYKTTHTAPELRDHAVYGQPETMRAELARLAEEHAQGNAVVVGCAGCYVTASILAAAPAMHAGLAQETSPMIIDAISGVTGAGRKATAKTHFCSADESVEAYGLPHHRHAPEIAQAYARLHPRLDDGDLAHVIFTPHLAPLRRGLLSTVYIPLAKQTTTRDLHALYEKHYADEALVSELPESVWPKTASVEGTARAHVNVSVNEEEQVAVCMCAIDNLGKGASAQAVQCANIVCGLPENTGLELLACIP